MMLFITNCHAMDRGIVFVCLFVWNLSLYLPDGFLHETMGLIDHGQMMPQ